MYPWFTVISAVVQIGSTIFRSECIAARSVFAPAAPQKASAAAKTKAMILRERDAMTPPSPCGPMVPACPPAADERRRTLVALRLALLLDIPEHRCGRGQDAVDILARADRLIVLAEMDVCDALALAHLHLFDDRLLLGGIGLAGEIVAQLLELLVAGPAEHRLVAACVGEPGHHRIENVGGYPSGEHCMPAAGVRRVLLGAARHDRLPVARLHVDLEAALLHQ